MDKTYKVVEKILRQAAKKHNLAAKATILNSQAKEPKPQLHLYGRKAVAIGKKKPQPTYIVGVMKHKDKVTFYSMAVYAFPAEFKLSPDLTKILKGKSCFHIKELSPKREKELAAIVEQNIKIFKREGWI